jgi:type I restriction enzyme S subunit
MGDTMSLSNCEWKEYKLSDVAEIQTGPFGSQLHQRDYKLVGTPIITVEHLGENKIIHQNVPLVGDEDRQRLIKYTLQEGDIVFSRVGSVDRRVYVSKEENGWMFSGRCLRVRPDYRKVHPKFLSYYFGQESFKELIRRIAVGATMPSINTTILSEVDIVLPDLDYQFNVASILSSLDDKIDLHRRQNKTLERLAETLFRQWFVEEGNEIILIGNVASVTTGKGLKREEFIEDGKFPILGANGEIGRTNKYLTESKLILTGRVGTLGKVYLSDDKVWISDNVLIVNPFDEKFFYPIYFNLKSIDFENLNVGSTQPLVTQTEVKKIELKIPTKQNFEEFAKICSYNFEKIKTNQIQIRTLTQLRDTLLPKLMSGEVRIKT